MTVKFKDVLSAQGCVIVSSMFEFSVEPGLIFPTPTAENEREVLRWATNRSLPLCWQATVPSHWPG